MTLTQSSVVWRGLTVSSTSDFRLRDIQGWDELPGYSTETVELDGRHGASVAPIKFAARMVTVSGWCYDPASRDSLLAEFRSGLAPLSDTTVVEPLTVTHGGLTLSADARLVKVSATPEAGWALGRFGWVVQWLCSDPLRYGAYVSVLSALTSPVTGLALPTSLPAAFPAKPIGGLFTVDNTGTALAPAVFTLQGQISSPGIVLNGGTQYQKIISFDSFSDLGVGDSLVVDTARGGSFLNGSYRAPVGGSALTIDLMMRPGTNTVSAIGQPGSGSPSISALFRPAYW